MSVGPPLHPPHHTQQPDQCEPPRPARAGLLRQGVIGRQGRGGDDGSAFQLGQVAVQAECLFGVAHVDVLRAEAVPAAVLRPPGGAAGVDWSDPTRAAPGT